MSHPYREHDIAFLSQTYADMEAVNRQLEHERGQHKVVILAINIVNFPRALRIP